MYACVMLEAERGVSVVIIVLTLLSIDRLAKLTRPKFGDDNVDVPESWRPYVGRKLGEAFGKVYGPLAGDIV